MPALAGRFAVTLSCAGNGELPGIRVRGRRRDEGAKLSAIASFLLNFYYRLR